MHTAGHSGQVRPMERARTNVPDERLTVFVVDDDVSVCESLEALIRSNGWEARTFRSGSTFLADHAASGPCCVLLDISLPDLNGLELQGILAGERREMPIIFITGFGDVPSSVRAMKAGAVEFLTKPFDDEELLYAISSALESSRKGRREHNALQALRSAYGTLTPREREVMALVVSGLLNKQVAGQLGISEITVKAHRGRVMQKMKARSLAQLVKMSASLDTASEPER